MAHPSIIAATERYHPVARILHWAVAICVIAALPLGIVIQFVRDDVKMPFYILHESFGFLVLWLMLVRLAFRLVVRPPPEVPMPGVFRMVASIVHTLLYIALISQPILGLVANSYNGFPLDWFWVIRLEPFTVKDGELAKTILSAHVAVGWAILVLFALHIGGVLFHHVIRRDATLYRMV